MRRTLFILALLLAGCGGHGDGTGPAVPVQHAPAISNLKLAPSSVEYMTGDGQAAVMAELGFADAGQDIATLCIVMPDGTRVDVAKASSATTGTVSEQITMSTKTVGTFTVEVWLVDGAGGSSNRLSANFNVVSNVPSGEWTNRLSGLPFALHDVVWNGTNFIAVGDDGKILTSSDGIDWVEQHSGTDAGLDAVAFYGSKVVAVGNGATVLLSLDGGVNWTTKHVADRVNLSGVAINSNQIVAGGMHLQTGDAFMMRSLDGGESWATVQSLPQSGHFVTDLVYVNSTFVAATDVFSPESDARVMVSSDGDIWNEIILRDEVAALHAILYDGQKYIAAGYPDAVLASADGFNWTELDTPVDRVSYLSAAWNGSRLVLAGGITWWYWWMGPPNFERPVGLSSADGGATWEIFNIDGYYQSNGMAWGNGRFVSVGETTPISGLGAIYTSD